MTSTSKNVYIDKLDDIVNKYNNAYHKTIKMKPVDVKENTYIDLTELCSDDITISEYKNIFAKGYTPNWSEEGFVIEKIKNTVPWTYVINDLNGDKIIGTFYEKVQQRTNQQELGIEQVIKKKGDNYMSNGKVIIINLIAGLMKIT